MKIIPAIDIIEGRVVRLKKGDYDQKVVYHKDPIEVAKSFEGHGLSYLHLVDLDGAEQGRLVNASILEKICSATQLKVDVGGGIKKEEDLQRALDAGAEQVNIGSLAVKAPEVLTNWMEKYGPEKFILSADVKEGFIAINGWKTLTEISLNDLVESFVKNGLQTVTSTDIARDGMLLGPSLDLYEGLRKKFPSLNCIASGGIRDEADLYALHQRGVYGAIVGRAIYEGTLALDSLKNLSF